MGAERSDIGQDMDEFFPILADVAAFAQRSYRVCQRYWIRDESCFSCLWRLPDKPMA